MKNIHQEIKRALALLEQIKISEYKLDSVGIGTKDSSEFDQLAEDLLKISIDSKEIDNTLMAKLKEKIDTVEYVRLSKPESLSDVSVQVTDFENAKEIYPEAEFMEGEGWKLLQIKTDKGTIYISNISESEHYFGSKDESSAEEDEVSKLKAELDSEKQKRISLMADFQNYQRRVEGEKANWGALSNMSLINEMLEIHDDLQLAMQDENLNLDHSKAAIKSAQDKLVDAVKRNGIEKVEVKVGDIFDKEKMEAVSMVPVQDESQKGKVIAVISSAYKYANKEHVLKAAKVVVGK